MNKLRESKVLVSLLSAMFFTTPLFESNPQSCGMIRVITKKKEEECVAEEDMLSTNYKTKK